MSEIDKIEVDLTNEPSATVEITIPADPSVEIYADPHYIILGGHLRNEFTFESFLDGKLLIGNMLSDYVAGKVVLDIQSEFDDGIEFTIGDIDAQGRLMTATDNEAQSADTYHTEPNHKYESSTPVYLFINSSATKGSGNVTIYLQ